jgi:branched-subunit amino acid aminotransferase/4-amino-4-deoxychorismate lyase
MHESYIIYNGEVHKKNTPVLENENRAFLYGDAIFETIRAYNTKCQFLGNHIIRLFDSMKILDMEIPGYFSKDYFATKVKELLIKNNYNEGARVRITVFRNSGGLYTPDTNQVSYLMTCSGLKTLYYCLNSKGLTINLYDEITKPVNKLSVLKTTNALLFVKGSIFRKKNNLDDCLILNQYNHIIESLSSNIFLKSNQKIFTPGIDQGCLPGTMRKTIISILNSSNLNVVEETKLSIDDLLNAEELFITNAIQGIQWVSNFRSKAYSNQTSQYLLKKLNELALEDSRDTI